VKGLIKNTFNEKGGNPKSAKELVKKTTDERQRPKKGKALPKKCFQAWHNRTKAALISATAQRQKFSTRSLVEQTSHPLKYSQSMTPLHQEEMMHSGAPPCNISSLAIF
jgi:hypothetical protein